MDGCCSSLEYIFSSDRLYVVFLYDSPIIWSSLTRILCKESSTDHSRQEVEKSYSTAAEKDSDIQGEGNVSRTSRIPQLTHHACQQTYNLVPYSLLGFFHEEKMDQYFLGVKDLLNGSNEVMWTQYISSKILKCRRL